MTTNRRDSPISSQISPPIEFPTLQQEYFPLGGKEERHNTSHNGYAFPASSNGAPAEQRWHPRNAGLSIINSWNTRRSRQKSLSEAWQNIRRRKGSMGENAKEIGEALKAPVSFRLVILCLFWFMCSIFSNASSKSILIAFRKPVTLTIVQFFFVSGWCVVSSMVAQRFPAVQHAIPALRYPIRPPSRELIMATLPLTAFQVAGHILNSDAMSRIPVSLVHTIKGLSPVFTVAAYRLFYRVHYSIPTYLSLIPLTLGVILACSANISGDLIGLTYAFGSTILFVTQNIASKKLFNEAARAESDAYASSSPSAKPDKLNLLCYSSALAFLITAPLWVWSEGIGIVTDVMTRGTVPLSARPDALDHGRLSLEFIFNGTFHFIQSLVAFILLSMVSPVTYSVASLIKRVFVICFAIIWFGNPVTNIQRFGIALTFLGLYLYDRTSDAARADKRARAMQALHQPLLPLIKEDSKSDSARYPAVFAQSPVLNGVNTGWNSLETSNHMEKRNGKARDHPVIGVGGGGKSPQPVAGKRRLSNDAEHSSAGTVGAGRNSPNSGWLPPGTRVDQDGVVIAQNGAKAVHV